MLRGAGDDGELLGVRPQCPVLRVGSRTLLTPKNPLESFAEVYCSLKVLCY